MSNQMNTRELLRAVVRNSKPEFVVGLGSLIVVSFCCGHQLGSFIREANDARAKGKASKG